MRHAVRLLVTLALVLGGSATASAQFAPMSPNGSTNTRTPTFTWSAVSGSTQYQVWVDDAEVEGRDPVEPVAHGGWLSEGDGDVQRQSGCAARAGARDLVGRADEQFRQRRLE